MTDPNDQWINVELNVATEFIGFDADYHHPRSAELTLEVGEKAKYDADPANAKIFVQTRNGKIFSALEMVSILLKETNTPRQNLIPPATREEAFKKGRAVFMPDLTLTFTPNAFHTNTNIGPVNLSRLRIYIRATVTPKRQS